MDFHQKSVGMEALLTLKDVEIKKLSDVVLYHSSLNAELLNQNNQFQENVANNVATISQFR